MSLLQLREDYKAWKKWLRGVRHREAAFENQQYPIVKVAVRDAGEKPFQLLIKFSRDTYTQDYWFATLEEAEAGAAEFKRNLDAAKEANKRIQEMIHGA